MHHLCFGVFIVLTNGLFAKNREWLLLPSVFVYEYMTGLEGGGDCESNRFAVIIVCWRIYLPQTEQRSVLFVGARRKGASPVIRTNKKQ